jgi:hypothetical protein
MEKDSRSVGRRNKAEVSSDSLPDDDDEMDDMFRGSTPADRTTEPNSSGGDLENSLYSSQQPMTMQQQQRAHHHDNYLLPPPLQVGETELTRAVNRKRHSDMSSSVDDPNNNNRRPAIISELRTVPDARHWNRRLSVRKPRTVVRKVRLLAGKVVEHPTSSS